MRRSFVSQVLMLALVAFAAGCDNTSETPLPTNPSATPINEPAFTGTLNVNGAVTSPFSTTVAGSVTATLTSIEPNVDSKVVIGLSLGTWNGTACQIVLADDAAVVGRSVLGTAAGPGSLCARVYDVGKLTETVTFTVQISHF